VEAGGWPTAGAAGGRVGAVGDPCVSVTEAAGGGLGPRGEGLWRPGTNNSTILGLKRDRSELRK